MTIQEAITKLDQSLWRARAAADYHSCAHAQIGGAIDALENLKTILAQQDRIIAAAPDMLAALKELLYARTDKAEALARAAIDNAKAIT